MGNRLSRRHQQEEEIAQQATNSSLNAPGMQPPRYGTQIPVPQSSHYAQYPPPQQQPHYRPPGSVQTQPFAPYYVPAPQPGYNGQYYGGWRPPAAPPGGGHQRYSGAQQGAQQRSRLQSQEQQVPSRNEESSKTQELTQTATIRNAVNLKKQTLKVSPVKGDLNKLRVSFTFDASSPCALSIFVLAEEDVTNACQLNPTAQPPAPLMMFDSRLGHTFPPTDTDESIVAKHDIDLSRCGAEPADSLAAPTGDVYPLIIRLETITEKGQNAGHTLDELSPGAEQKSWIQSQTTFAAIIRELNQDKGTSEWTARVLKQKIWVEGTSYELQEIYGLEQAASGKAGDDSEERLCVICLSARRDTTVLPCRHLCLCHECAQEWRRQSSRCPICRMKVESLLRIRMKQKSLTSK